MSLTADPLKLTTVEYMSFSLPGYKVDIMSECVTSSTNEISSSTDVEVSESAGTGAVAVVLAVISDYITVTFGTSFGRDGADTTLLPCMVPNAFAHADNDVNPVVHGELCTGAVVGKCNPAHTLVSDGAGVGTATNGETTYGAIGSVGETGYT